MAAIDADWIIQALSDYLGQDVTLKTGVTVNVSSVRRSGPDGGTVVIVGTITKDGQEWRPAGGWPIVWTEGVASTKQEALQAARDMLANLVPA